MTTDIKPDTSLYTTPADRLAAFAMALRDESPIRPLQSRLREHENEWVVISSGARSYPGMASNCLDGFDYRLKPEPRVVWVNFHRCGTAFFYDTEDQALKLKNGERRLGERHVAIAVRVELPE